MKKYFFLILYLSVGFSTASYAQFQTKFEVAKDLYDRLAYSDAIPMLEDYLAKKDLLEAKVILADCYRQNNQYTKAEEWYAKAVADKNLQDVNQNLYYAQVLQTLGKYEDAAKQYNVFLAKNPNDKRAKNQYEACADIGKIKGNDGGFVIEKLSFNTDGYDFGACLSNNKFIYTSTGGKNKKGEKINSWTGEAFMDLYSVDVDDKGELSASPQKWATAINTKYNEGPLCFSNDNKVYFTRNNYNPDEKKGKKLTYSVDKEANLKIYEATSNGKGDSGWSNIKQLPFNDKNYSCGHPTISKEGNTLYFASNMPGGFGGTDIWKVQKAGEIWSKPVNLGNTINTEGEEMFPSVTENNTLYFASNGLAGLGGLDIFSYDLNSAQSVPKNIGSPFNTSYDDFAYLMDKSGNFGFLSSNRTDGAGEDDIYKFVNNKYTLEILVVDKETQQPIQDAEISLLKNDLILQSLKSPVNGSVSANVYADSTYKIVADAYQYIPDSVVKIIAKDESQRIQKVKIELSSLLMQVMVINADSKEPISNTMVTVKGKCLTEPKILQTDVAGNTSTIKIQNDCDYNLLANAKGYIPNNKDVQIRNVNGIYKVIIELKPIDDKPIVLNNIYYDFDKWNIRTDAEPDLNFLMLFLNTNPEAKIELSSHTDARGDDAYNKSLSQKRAQSAVDWLISHGIDKKRMKAVGYGETQPVNNCTNNVACTEEEHQRNRRTEFKVLNAGQVTSSAPKKDIKVDKCLNCKF